MTTLDTERYTSAAFLRRERERLWPRVWQMAGLSTIDRLRALKGMERDMLNPGAQFQRKKERSTRGPVDRSAIRDKKKQQRKQAKQQRKRNKRR